MAEEAQRDIDGLIEYLSGTCKSIEEAQETFGIEELTEDEQEQIDNEIFNCSICGWWSSIEECQDDYGEQVCTECYD